MDKIEHTKGSKPRSNSNDCPKQVRIWAVETSESFWQDTEDGIPRRRQRSTVNQGAPPLKEKSSDHRVPNPQHLTRRAKMWKTINENLATDIEASQACEIDVLLQYFLYLSLKPDKKAEMDHLQMLIEELEISLDAQEHNRPTEPHVNSSNGVNAMETETNIKLNEINNDKSDATHVNPDEVKLAELSRKRRAQLQQIFDECMDKIINLCTHFGLKKHLSDYACEDMKDETERYAPYVLAANLALDLLKDIEFDSLRGPSPLDIRFHRNHPKYIVSHFEGFVDIPDVIITSLVAAQDAAVAHDIEGAIKAPPTPIYESAPVESFPWRAILSCHEFKQIKTKIMSRLPGVYEKSYVGPKYDSNGDGIFEDLCEMDASVTEGREDDQSEPAPKRMKLAISSSSGVKASRSNSRPGSNNAKLGSVRGSRVSRVVSTACSEVTSEVDMKPQEEAAAETSKSLKTQCGNYALEMMSVAPGVHHAISCLIVDFKLWIFYYDRQGILQSYGMDFIKNLPRFLILLVAFQRFQLEDWGVFPMLNPPAKLAHDLHPKVPSSDQQRYLDRQESPDSWFIERRLRHHDLDGCLDIQDDKIKLSYSEGIVPSKIDILLSDNLSSKSFTISGRAGTVFVASAEGYDDIVCKIYNPEVERQSEGVVLQKTYEKVEENKIEWIKDHLPAMLLCGDIPSCSTNRIRSMANVNWKGYRTMRFLVFRKLNKLTELSGEDFMKAWFEIVVCHAYLWDMGVHHGDPSLGNSMCAPDTKKGVLSDFDLATLEDMPRRPGHKPTGTIPFMAIDLLTKEYWDGGMPRMYHHELEAFIWILPYVFLRYPQGQAVFKTKVDAWMTSDYNVCRVEKVHFCFGNNLSVLYKEIMSKHGTTRWKKEWIIAAILVTWVSETYSTFGSLPWEEDTAEELGIWESVRSTRKAFIKICRLQLESRFPYICGYLDKLETSVSNLPVDR